MRFEINYPPTKRAKAAWNKRFGLNAYYSGKHWSQRKKDAEELHMICRAAMHRAGIRDNLLDYPVEIKFWWDDCLDVDNHAALGKAFVDAMKGKILHDDNRQWLKKVSHEYWDGGKILVGIRRWSR